MVPQLRAERELAMRSTISANRWIGPSLLAIGVAAATACGSSAGSDSSDDISSSTSSESVESTNSGDSGEADDGSTLTMWVRSPVELAATALVEEYNATHDNQVELTSIPGETFLQKVGAAAGSDALPDILAADVVYSPNYVEEGLYADLTERINSLSFVDDLAPSHLEAASQGGKMYGVPLSVDSSLLFWNKDLFEQAGLDPDVAPASYDEIVANAKAIRDLGDDIYGFYFAGECGGCFAYTWFPSLDAADEAPLSDDGQTVNLDTKAMQDLLTAYRTMVTDDSVPSGALTENGATWTTSFVDGTIGIAPFGNFAIEQLKDAPFEYGISQLPAPDGSAAATFVGGDVVGIAASSDQQEQAWDFISWSLSETAQVEVLAKNGHLPSRVDLAGNQYSSEDPRVSQVIEGLADGYTPKALQLGAMFNDNTAPWLQQIRAVVVRGEDPVQATAELQSDEEKLIE